MHMSLLTVAVLVFVLNLPFGYWRANEPKFSRGWFLAVHLPVPFVIALRLLSGLGFHWVTFPVLIGAFFLGQLTGGLVHVVRQRWSAIPATSCLVLDLAHAIRPGRDS